MQTIEEACETCISDKVAVEEIARRYRLRSELAQLYPEFSYVRSAAEERLTSIDQIDAIWLYGSRARGMADSQSDWDLAVITHSNSSDAQKVCWHGYLSASGVYTAIPCYEFHRDLMYAKRNSLGHLAREVTSDGIPLAERNWQLPVLAPYERVIMDADGYLRHLKDIADSILRIGAEFRFLSDAQQRTTWRSSGETIVEKSQNLATSFVKASVIRREVQVPLTKKIEELTEPAHTVKVGRDFAQTIRSFNVTSSLRDAVRNVAITPTDIDRAAKRIELVCSAFSTECRQAIETLTRMKNVEVLAIQFEALAQIQDSLSSSAKILCDAIKPVKIENRCDLRIQQNIEAAWCCRQSLLECFVTTHQNLADVLLHHRSGAQSRSIAEASVHVAKPGSRFL